MATLGQDGYRARPLWLFFRPLLPLLPAAAAPAIACHGWYLWRRAGSPAGEIERLEPVAFGVLASTIVLNAGPIDAFIYFQF